MVWLALVGCEVVVRQPADRTFSAEIGPEGGELVGGGLTLTVPAGALADATTLTLHVDDSPAPDGGPSLSSGFRFEPEGLFFDDWVHVAIESADGAGALLWSTLDDPDTFEEIGLAAGGLAEGDTVHFSESFVAEGSCPLPVPTCGCRASDDQADLLCLTDPTGGEDCDFLGFSGAEGQPCTGYGPRPVIESWCDCRNDDVGYLCPDPMVFEPSQECPSERGLNGFHGAPYEACQGYDLDNALRSGAIQSCSVETMDTVYQPVQGTLEGCTVDPTARKAPPADRCTTSQRDWSDDCLDVLDGYAKGRTQACPDLGDPVDVGIAAGAALEKAWRESKPGARVSQLVVPNANKDDCRNAQKPTAKAKDRDPSNWRGGSIDLAEVVLTNANEVVVKIGEVKPLTRSGLDLGWREVYECYADAVERAAGSCKKPAAQRTADEAAFCKQLGADGKRVVLDSDPGVSWAPAKAPFPYDAHTCADGLVAYTCP